MVRCRFLYSLGLVSMLRSVVTFFSDGECNDYPEDIVRSLPISSHFLFCCVHPSFLISPLRLYYIHTDIPLSFFLSTIV